ncbi:MAG: LLM class flavin-dependent oxidoreductase [Streptomycetales bacterium]
MTATNDDTDLNKQLTLCHEAEQRGVDSVLIDFGFGKPDPFAWAAALGRRTTHLKLLVAVRAGVSSPTYCVQQVNTVAAVTGGRVCVAIADEGTPDDQRYYGDVLGPDARHRRSDEFWSVCHGLWRDDEPVDFSGSHYHIEGAKITTPFVSQGRSRPEIYVAGDSEQAAEIAVRHADCLFVPAASPEGMASRMRPVLESGTEVGLEVSLIAAAKRDDAIRNGQALLGQEQNWLTPHLCAVAPDQGSKAVALVGSAADVVEAIFEFQAAGVTQFLFTGYPDLEQMVFFGEEILPRVREREHARAGGGSVSPPGPK